MLRVRRWLVGLFVLGVLGPVWTEVKAQASRTLKFEIYQDAKQEYRWRLKATNSQIIATSGEGYTAKSNCRHAIDVIKRDADTAKLTFETYQDAKQEYRWRLKSPNGQIIAASGQGYSAKRDCDHAIDVIKKGAEGAQIGEIP